MAEVEFARNEIADPQGAQRVGSAVSDAARAVSLAHDVLTPSIGDELRLEIAVEAPGTEAVAVPSPTRPGAVRGTVEKVLRDLGLKKV